MSPVIEDVSQLTGSQRSAVEELERCCGISSRFYLIQVMQGVHFKLDQGKTLLFCGDLDNMKTPRDKATEGQIKDIRKIISPFLEPEVILSPGDVIKTRRLDMDLNNKRSMAFAAELDVNLDTDHALLLFFFVCRASSMNLITEADIVQGILYANVRTLKKLAHWLKKVRLNDICADEESERQFFRWMFHFYLDRHTKTLSIEYTEAVFTQILPGLDSRFKNSWGIELFDHLRNSKPFAGLSSTMVDKSEEVTIYLDLWMALRRFFLEFHNGNNWIGFDLDESNYPVILDDFIEHKQNKIDTCKLTI